MSTPCDYNYQIVGPFNQTLYLGCSVVDFSMNMGWGGEPSSCTINLATDYSAHYHSNVFGTNTSSLNNINIFQDKDLLSKALTNQFDFRKNLHRTISYKEAQKRNEAQNIDLLTMDNPSLLDNGKKCWPTYLRDPTPELWYSFDPGFLGNKNHFLGRADLDIIGCPTFFRFADIWFGGMIKNWKFSNGKYTVELNSFASLLKGCILILQKYYGSISTLIPNTEDALNSDTAQLLAVPYGDTGIPVDSRNAFYNPNSYKGSIYQGNIPNVFNIFGWLEKQGFGYSGYIPDRGISAGLVYDAIVALLNSLNRQQNQFNPYGAIVAKTPLRRDSGQLFDPYQTFYEEDTSPIPAPNSPALRFADIGLIRCPIAVDGFPRSLLRLDLSDVPRPPNDVYISADTMDLATFIDFCCENAGFDFMIDFEPDILSSNYSGAIKIKTISRRVQPLPNTIKDFILNFTAADKVVDYNFGEEHNDTKTRSILIGGPQQRLHQFTTHTYGLFRHSKLFEPMLNRFVDTRSTMNVSYQSVGSNKNTYRMPDHNNQRPFQNVSWKADTSGGVTAQTRSDFWNSLEQSPYGQMNINRGSYFNIERPILNNQTVALDAVSYPLYKDIISPYFGKSINSEETRKVYFDNRTRQLQIVIDFRDIQHMFPTAYDIRDGNWGSASQLVKQYYPGQLKLSPWADITGQPTGGDVGYGKFVVTEQELRYAMGADNNDMEPFDNWWAYTKMRAAYNYPTAISRILYDYWARALFPPFSEALFKTSIIENKYADYYGFLRTISAMGLSLPMRVGTNVSALEDTLTAQQYYQALSDSDRLLKSIHAFIKNMGDSYYGKAYAIRLPAIDWYVDDTGKTRYSYEICDGAWEEPGNTIDDTMQVGSPIATSFADEQGKFGPILAFDNMAEYFQPFIGGLVGPPNVVFQEQSPILSAYVAIQGGLDTLINGGRNRWYFPLSHNLPADSFAMIPYASFQVAAPPGLAQVVYSPFPVGTTAFGFTPSNDQKYKLYVKSSVSNENINDINNPNIFLVEGLPRVVLQTPSPVTIKDFDSPSSELFAWALYGDEKPSEVGGIFSILGGSMGAARGLPLNRAASNIIMGFYMDYFNMSRFNSYPPGSIRAAPRAAAPVFAAVPIKNNLMCYGPWVSHPGIIKDIVFPDMNDNSLDITMVNNLAGGVDIQIDDSLVPWEYGGMSSLDSAALKKVAENNNFQQVLEYGSLTLAGIQLSNTRLGGKLFNRYYAPIVTSLNVSIGVNGISTRYDMRTFSRKLGFFNKEQADMIQKINREFIKNYQRAYQQSNNVLNRVLMYSKPATKIFSFNA